MPGVDDPDSSKKPPTKDDALSRLRGRFTAGVLRYFLVAGLALLVLLLYVVVAASTGEPGLPLDDGWIHQTYARNLAQSGQWAYTPGVISAGSTSPLWTLALAIGYLLRAPYLVWAFFLGWLSLSWVGWSGMDLWSTLWPNRADIDWLIGLILILTWPLVWAAGSGMETLLFIALVLQLLVLYSRQVLAGAYRVWLLGILAGLSILTRPDGLSLLLLIVLGLFIAGGTIRERLLRVIKFLVTAALLLLPYFALNLFTSGALWPNTFYAKQAEYAFLWREPLILRFFRLLYFTLGGPAEGLRGISGAHLLLMPGLFISGWVSLRRDWSDRRLLLLLPLLWAAGHVFLYAWRLPVLYQHGRYLMPAIPIFILYGLAGWLHLIKIIKERFQTTARLDFLWKNFSRLTFALLLIYFLFLGLLAYAQDVAFINAEMVSTARWLEKNTPPDTLIAAHDIGAIGYFGDRQLLDLAGLISPEVIPLLSDQDDLVSYVKDSGAEYLVTAPGWPYEELTKTEDAILLYSTDYAWTQEQGINNMEIYQVGR